jgi:FkbM family methyltransferase
MAEACLGPWREKGIFAMRERAKHLIRAAAGLMGLEVRRHQLQDDTLGILAWHCCRLGVTCCLDVGANTGGFAQELRRRGFAGSLISLEPRREAHAALTAAAAGVAGWHIAQPVALGAREGEAIIHIAGNEASSSLLPMLPRHEAGAPGSAYRGQQPVRVRRLDDVIAEMDIAENAPLAMKIDTQGFEREVLIGAAKTLDRTAILMIEMSLTPLYAGAPSFEELYTDLIRQGWRCITLSPAFFDTIHREALQVDGLFLREHSWTPPPHLVYDPA